LMYLSKIDTRRIVIRNFDFIDFTPTVFNKFSPNKKLNNNNIMSNYFKIKNFALIRNSIDIYKSMITSSHKIQDPEFVFYAEYIKNIIKHKIKIFYYEDLCSDPLSEVARLFNYIGIEFKPSFLKEINNEKVLGDISSNNLSRGYNKTEIIELQNKITLEDLSPTLKIKLLKIDRYIKNIR